MGHAAQGEEYRFVEQGAGHDPLRGDDRLRCPGVAVQDLVGRREAGVGRFSLRVRKTAATIFDCRRSLIGSGGLALMEVA